MCIRDRLLPLIGWRSIFFLIGALILISIILLSIFTTSWEIKSSVESKNISDKTILDFHLSHITNDEFKFEPNETTSKIIWRYLSSSNLLEGIENIDLEDQKKFFT